LKEELIIKEIENHKEDHIDFLQEIIKTESYNPPGNEKDVALKFKEYFDNYRIQCEIFPFGENRANLIASLNDNFEENALLYNGHMDVVPPGTEEEWKYPPLSAHIKRNKYLYGRGSTDMKGGLTAMAISLQILKTLNIKTNKNLVFSAVSGEETGGRLGTLWSVNNILKPRNIKCDFAVVGEPTGLEPLPKAIILGEKGHIIFKIITHGIAAHSSIPFEGKNAIYMMSEIIQSLNNLDNYLEKLKPPIPEEKLKRFLSEAFPNQVIFKKIFNEQIILQNLIKSLTVYTKSLNLIEGGIKDNVIPERCEAVIDFRTLPGQKTVMIKNALNQLIREIGYKVKEDIKGKSEKIYVEIELVEALEASYWQDWENSQTLKKLQSIMTNVYNKKSFYLLYPACSDARHLRNTGYCPKTVLLGPGSATTAHAMDEYIELEDFINMIKVYSLFANDYLTRS